MAKKPDEMRSTLTKSPVRKNPSDLSERDLEKVSGGLGSLKVSNTPDIKGPSTRDGHEDEIEIH